MKYSVKHELFLLSHAKDVCICACVIFSVHLGGISHRCMHSSCSENSSSRVIYYPNSPVITAVFVLNTPPTLLQPEQPCPPLANSTTSLGHTVCCSHQDPGAPLFFFIIYAFLQIYLCQPLVQKTRKVRLWVSTVEQWNQSCKNFHFRSICGGNF